MALIGRFGNTSGRPYVEARLLIPRLNVHADLSFLVDTGADRTYLMPGDATLLRLYESIMMPALHVAVGAGGSISGDFVEQAVLVFSDVAYLYVYDFQIIVAPDNNATRGVPSLLGRNIIDSWHLTYSPGTQTLAADVMSCSAVLEVPREHSVSPWRALE